jgi:hypothetical protein
MSYLRLSFLILAAGLLIGGLASTALAEEEQLGDTAETTSAPNYTLVWNGPRSLDNLVDERRDALRDRREAFRDSMRRLYGVYSPWMDYERTAWRTYSDQMRELYRAHRDATKFHHDLQRSYFMPWGRAFTEAADARRFALAMDSLDRQERMDELRYAYQPVFGGPYFPW